MKQETSPGAKVFSFVLGMFLVAWLFQWYSYVIWHTLPYWQCLVFTPITYLFRKSFDTIGKYIFGGLFFVVLIAQVLAWMHYIQIPLIKN